VSSTCFEPEGSSSGRRLYTRIQLRYSVFHMHQYKQSCRYIPTRRTRLLILMHVKQNISYLYKQPSSWRWTLGFETCRRHKKIRNQDTNLEKAHFVGLYCIIKGTLLETPCTFISRWILLWMTNVADKSCRENQNTLFTFIFPPEIVQFVEVEKGGKGRQVTNDNAIRCRKDTVYTLNNQSKKEYRHTPIIFN